MVNEHRAEVLNGKRFEFGANWSRFLSVLDVERITLAEQSLCKMLGVGNLTGKSFLDVGCGSGLFSLAARRLGATVRSFDYDPQSVACTRELKRKYYAEDKAWIIDEASILDKNYLSQLGEFDVVYSWGVLHHTGAMWGALSNVTPLVADRGQLFIAIYNDQGWVSKYWLAVKKLYNRNSILKALVVGFHSPYLYGLRGFVRFYNGRLLERGMNLWHDMLDWLGGYPFEVAKPEEILAYYYEAGFNLTRLQTCGGRLGCNEYVFSNSFAKR